MCKHELLYWTYYMVPNHLEHAVPRTLRELHLWTATMALDLKSKTSLSTA